MYKELLMPRNRTAGRIFEHELGANQVDSRYLNEGFGVALKKERAISGEGGYNEVAVNSIIDPNMDTELLAEAEERARKLEESMKELPADFREVLVKHYYEDKSSEEIAEELGIKEPLVRKRLSRAREKLKELMGG